MIACILLLFLSFKSIESSSEWGYSGRNSPRVWKTRFPTCGNRMQSPIRIRSTQLVFRPGLGKIKLHGYGDPPDAMTILNNGHTAVVSLTGHITAKDGGLKGVYKARQFHFHWGSDSTKGSEHSIDYVRYPMEMHIVHYSTKYADIFEALGHPSGIAVLGFMFEKSEKDNPRLAPLVAAVQKVIKKDTELPLTEPFALRTFLPFNTDIFYRYQGSLTTPPCSEVVTWTIFRNTIPISEAQLEVFRELRSSTNHMHKDAHISNNYRPIQKLHKRKVYCNFPRKSFLSKDKK